VDYAAGRGRLQGNAANIAGEEELSRLAFTANKKLDHT
jgi:hypothetical protein